MPERISSDLSQAIFDTLLYSDIFDFPLKAGEIHRYLSGRAATYDDVSHALNMDPSYIQQGEYFTLPGRGKIVYFREQREQRSQELLPYALAYGRIMGFLPFIRMVALTGSLAVHNVSQDEDFDYMLVTQPGRLWTARAFVLLLGRFTRLVRHTICPNVIVAEDSLEWRLHDMYSARDLCQMIPITGMNVYQSLMKANGWVMDYLPNAYAEAVTISTEKKHRPVLQRLFELLLRGPLGERFERWEMHRKIERFSRQEGFGVETIFNAGICQGNFDHHRQWTRQELGKRGASIDRKDSIKEDGL